MGTRGAFGFRVNKQDKVTYNHFDSYPSGLGQDVLEYVAARTPQKLKAIASAIVMVNSDSKPNEEQIAECAPWTNLDVSNQTVEDWYCLLRNSQGNLEAYENGLKYMIDSQSFLLDSLFCEYAYIINLDENVLEFYSGFNQISRTRMGRYANQTERADKPEDRCYYGVARVAKISLTDICGASKEQLNAIVSKMDKKAEGFYKRQERQLNKKVVA